MIEKDFPVPRPSTQGVKKYPFVDMSIGDSVFFEGEGSTSKPVKAARACGNSKGWKFTARSVDGGVRIWRIA